MMNGKTKVLWWIALTGVVVALGCASRPAPSGPAQLLCPEGVTTAQSLEAAHDVLVRMHFPIEKLDVEQGVIRTGPLRAGQSFEFWRSDNVGPFNMAEANLQTIRRSVELRVVQRSGHQRQATSDEVCLECDVSVQRLSLPGNEIASISQAYRIHSHSEPTVQRLAVTPQQERGMAWVDLGNDPQLAAKILRRVAQRLEASN